MAKKPKSQAPKSVEAHTHDEASRKNIPTAEYQSVMKKDDQAPVKVSYPRGSSEIDKEASDAEQPGAMVDLGSGSRQVVVAGKKKNVFRQDEQDLHDEKIKTNSLVNLETVNLGCLSSLRACDHG